MGSGIRTVVVIVLLAVTVCVFFGDVLFGSRVLITCNTFLWQPWRRHATDEQLAGRTYRTDSARTYLPRGVELKRRLEDGELPLWNPYAFSGSPFFADPQSRVVYPVSLLLTGFDPARALGYDVAIHFLLAMLGMYLFLRIIGTSGFGSLAGAFAYGFSSFFFLRMGHPTFVAAAGWIPFFFYGYERAKMSERTGTLLLSVFLSLGYLAGMPQLFLYGAAALVVYVICDSIEALAGREVRVVVGKVRILAVSAFLSGLVVAVQLVPFAEFLRNAEGQGLSLDIMRQTHLWDPVFLIRSVVPDFFGNPIDGTSWTGVVRGMVHPYNSGLMVYCGVTALMVAISGMVFIRVSRHIRALTVLLVLSVGMGTSVLLFKIVSAVLPLATYSQIDRISVIACFALAALAGKGLSVACLSTDRRLRRYFLITALVIVAALLGGSAVFMAKGPELISGFSRKASELLSERWFYQSGFKLREWLGTGTDRWLGFEHRQIARALVFGVVGLVSLILSMRFRPGSRIALGAGAVLVATILVDVGLTARRYYVSQPGDSLAPTPGIERIMDLMDEPGRWRIGNLEAPESALPSNIPQIYGIPMFDGTNAVLASGYADRLRHIVVSGDIQPAMGPATGTVGELMCVRYLVASDSMPAPPGDLAHSGYRLVHDGDMYVYENTAARPKGICVDRALIGPGFLRRPPGGGPPTLNLMPGLNHIDSLICGRCEIVRYEPERVELRVDTRKDCFLLLQDTYYPGWIADVDGMRLPVLRTDLGFRAVQLAAGEHSVVMRFRPLSFKLGLGLSCLGIILSVVYGTKKGFRQKSRKQG
ncbi:MAG: YfhO family protein [Candidatus Eisenbacteria bacterium]